MNKRIENIINTYYKSLLNKIMTETNGKYSLYEIKKIISKLKRNKDFNRLVKRLAIKISKEEVKYQKDEWKNYFFKVKKGKTQTALAEEYQKWEKKLLASRIKRNFKFIKSVPKEILKVYRQKDIKTLMEEVMKGTLPRGSFESQLKSHGYKNARLIARTESAKVLCEVDRYRALNLGSVVYEWKSNNDQRTRPSHKEMDSVIVFWRKNKKEKPYLDKMWGDAGEFPNCRCSRLPIYNPLDELKKTSYKVYNYKRRKIEVMRRYELLKNIEKGEIK